MKKIYKYSLPEPLSGPQPMFLPKGARILHAGLDPQGILCIWAMVDPANESENKVILVEGTGRELPDKTLLFISSVRTGPFVWHIFEVL